MWRDGSSSLLPSGPVVKICGLTRLEDVLLARDLGAWALGFVFAPSPRRLEPAAARGLIADLRSAGSPGSPAASPPITGSNVAAVAPVPSLPLAIGVFGDVSAEEIAAVVVEAGLDGVQLHGLAGPRADQVRAHTDRAGRPLVIIKAVPVASDATSSASLEASMAAAQEDADVVLLDTKSAGRFGGRGTPFPWRLARQAGGDFPVLVAGGIGPENVQTALDESGAWGVDVSSGVECSPGIKDPELVKRLFAQVCAARRAARRAARPGSSGSRGRAASPGAGPATASAGRARLLTDERQEGTDR